MHQVQKHPNVIVLIIIQRVYFLITPWLPCLKHFSILFFCRQSDRQIHRHKGIALHLLCMGGWWGSNQGIRDLIIQS